MDMALEAHRLLGCKGASRSDFRWDDEQGEAGLYLLEVNTQPGMTPLSLVPEQAQLARHQLWRAGRADHRRGARDERGARRGASAAAQRQGAARKRAEGHASRRRSPAGCRSSRRAPTSWPRWAFAGFLAGDRRGRR